MQSFKSFAVDINHALQSNSLSFDETEELSSALAVIQARLNGHRNSFAPINKLPSETLARVFEFVVAPEPMRDLGEWPASAPPRQATWNRRLVFVCTRWCTVITKCQRLWYYIVDDDLASAKRYSPRAILQQSGSTVPLHLYMAFTPRPPTDSVSRWIIKNQPLRVEALYIHLHEKTPPEAMLESLVTPLPSLRLLSVDANWEYRRVLGPNLPIILGEKALSLKALAWSLSIPFIPGNAFPNLADLNLYHLAGNVLDLDRLLRLLSDCPRLETLNFTQSSLDVTSGISRDRKLVRLDRLRALWMRSMTVNEALAALAYLQLPTYATVRLSDLAQHEYRSEPEEPSPVPVPFLQQMNDLVRLDVISNRVLKRGRRGHLHFIAVGTCSRFWIHFDTANLHGRAYVRYLYGMLPKKNLRTLRFSMQETADFVFVRDTMLEPLPSLDTLFVRQSQVVSRRSALSGVAAVSRALWPGGAPESYASDIQSDSDSEISSDNDPESPSGRHSHHESDDASHSDHSFSTTGQSTNARRNRDAPTDFPIDLTGIVLAPRLKVVGLEVQCRSTASLSPFVRVVEARKKCGHPLDTVLCSFKDVEEKDVDNLKEHVVDGIRDIPDKLWVPTIDEGWRMKNDYWRLYPEPKGEHEDEYEEWGLNMMEW